ncbi:MAG TPA: hypothetical protein VM346_05405 [Sphingomicrobium sp.]|nr:hypothetical protein [Sphingomicrobium sp.]
MKRLFIAFAAAAVATAASASDQIEAFGAERCLQGARSHTVTFLAPETADAEARSKVLVEGSEEKRRERQTLSIDGKPCPTGRCSFRSIKGHSYKLTAEVSGSAAGELCISVSRP